MKAVRVLSLQHHPWLKAAPLRRLLDILNEDGLKARLVGGCVRDTLLGRKIVDIDLACSLQPEETLKRLEQADIKVIPTGIKHGTLTAVIKGHSFEITSLRQDVETFGRHARVEYTDDWQEDARRRDFTFNALYLDGDGSLYDPCDGLKDLEQGKVRFIGNADQRIEEDALRILRFFRFAAQIGKGELDKEGLEACGRNRDLISHLSGERLAAEIFKILSAENLFPIISVMSDHAILDKMLPGNQGIDILRDFVRLENRLGRCDVLARLSCLLAPNKGAAEEESRHLKLSNQQQAILCHYAEAPVKLSPYLNHAMLRKEIFSLGREQIIYALLRRWAHSDALADDATYNELIDYAETWVIPTFPLLGRDLMQAGVSTGPRMGVLLKKLEKIWIESDFTLEKEDLLSRIDSV